MKKLVLAFSVLSVLCASIFADGFFEKRYFEIKVHAPANVSNNYFALGNLFTENVEINLTKLADDIPLHGLTTTINTTPEVALNLNLPVFSAGLNVGADVYGKVGVGKGLFDFLGKGYDVNEELKIDLNLEADVFAFATATAKFDVKYFSITAKPSVFVPLVHASPEYSYVSLMNKEDGTITADAKARIAAYSICDLVNFDSAELKSAIFNSMGVDVGGEIHCGYFDNFEIWGTVRVPLIPGRMRYTATVDAHANANGTVQKIVDSLTSESEGDKAFTWDYGMDPENPSDIKFKEMTSPYLINRPMKVNAYITIAPLPNIFRATGGVGLGIRNPFTKNMKELSVYPEYYIGAQIGFGNMLVFKASTEYTDQVFIHEAGLKFNLRLIEIDAGASLQSANFASSFKLAGFGAFVTCCIGF